VRRATALTKNAFTLSRAPAARRHNVAQTMRQRSEQSIAKGISVIATN